MSKKSTNYRIHIGEAELRLVFTVSTFQTTISQRERNFLGFSRRFTACTFQKLTYILKIPKIS